MKKRHDELDIPSFLLVKNRKALTSEQHAAIASRRVEQQAEERRNWNVPRHLDPEGEAMLAALNAPKQVRIVESIAKKDVSPRVSRDGLITIADLAKEFDMIPREARAILRHHKFPKPAQGWAFTTADCEAVRALLKAGPVDRHKPTPDRVKRVSKRRKGSRIPSGAGARGEVVFTSKATVTRPAPPTLAVHANIFEAKHASRIKEVPACPTPSASMRSKKKSSKKTSASPSSKKRSSKRQQKSKSTTQTKATRRRSTKRS